MPWQRSQLWLGHWDGDGALTQARAVAGSDGEDVDGISVFQPLWLDRGDLVVASDRSGWWNLELLEGATDPPSGEDGPPGWRPLLPMPAEFAMPQWVYGMRTIAWDGHRLVAAACRDGRWSLGVVPREGPAARSEGQTPRNPDWAPLAIPFDDLASLDAASGCLVAIAASPGHGQGLLEVDLHSGALHHTPAAPLPPELTSVSRPEAIWFSGSGGLPTHAWYYPPEGGANPHSPLLVRGHSGPTAMARTALSLVVQFWTSRGWGVVDVNYGGSTGFGRAYRQRLDGRWGVVDVEDCAAAARELVDRGWADAGRVAIEGSSASGFTVLAALCFTDVFRAGACRYGIADLAAMARETHRFEAGYLDTLIGPLPAAGGLYEARSPLHHADRIHCPLILFQGLDDQVVPPRQTEHMAEALRRQGCPVEVHLFPGEGHGFRSGEVQVRVLELTEAFFRHHFGL
jgi:acetyl esterase/lipase